MTPTDEWLAARADARRSIRGQSWDCGFLCGVLFCVALVAALRFAL